MYENFPITINYYHVLGLKWEDAPNFEQIKKAHHKKSRQNHPDRLKSLPSQNYHVTQSEVNKAYEILSDLKKRQAYDNFLRHTPLMAQKKSDIVIFRSPVASQPSHVNEVISSALIPYTPPEHINITA